MKSKEVLLLYRFRDTEIGRRLHAVAARMGILCRTVEEEDRGMPVGKLLKIPGFEAAFPQAKELSKEELPSMPNQMMVMYGLSSQRLDQFLQNLRKAGLPVIPLKAIVTPQNVSWTFAALYQELEREHAAMQARKAAQNKAE